MSLADHINQIRTLAGQGKSLDEIAEIVGLEMGDVESVLIAGTMPGQPASSGGSGGSQAVGGSPVVRKFPFAFDTPNLSTGAEPYTPTAGDVLLDAWIEIITAWDGTTPIADVGTFDSGPQGLWADATGNPSPLNMSIADFSGAVSNVLYGGWKSLSQAVAAAPFNRIVPVRFETTTPLKVLVSTTGLTTGADPGATQGEAVLYLVTATPV